MNASMQGCRVLDLGQFCVIHFIRASAEDSRSFVMVAAHVLEICSNLYKSEKN